MNALTQLQYTRAINSVSLGTACPSLRQHFQFQQSILLQNMSNVEKSRMKRFRDRQEKWVQRVVKGIASVDFEAGKKAVQVEANDARHTRIIKKCSAEAKEHQLLKEAQNRERTLRAQERKRDLNNEFRERTLQMGQSQEHHLELRSRRALDIRAARRAQLDARQQQRDERITRLQRRALEAAFAAEKQAVSQFQSAQVSLQRAVAAEAESLERQRNKAAKTPCPQLDTSSPLYVPNKRLYPVMRFVERPHDERLRLVAESDAKLNVKRISSAKCSRAQAQSFAQRVELLTNDNAERRDAQRLEDTQRHENVLRHTEDRLVDFQQQSDVRAASLNERSVAEWRDIRSHIERAARNHELEQQRREEELQRRMQRFTMRLTVRIL